MWTAVTGAAMGDVVLLVHMLGVTGVTIVFDVSESLSSWQM